MGKCIVAGLYLSGSTQWSLVCLLHGPTLRSEQYDKFFDIFFLLSLFRLAIINCDKLTVNQLTSEVHFAVQLLVSMSVRNFLIVNTDNCTVLVYPPQKMRRVLVVSDHPEGDYYMYYYISRQPYDARERYTF